MSSGFSEVIINFHIECFSGCVLMFVSQVHYLERKADWILRLSSESWVRPQFTCCKKTKQKQQVCLVLFSCFLCADRNCTCTCSERMDVVNKGSQNVRQREREVAEKRGKIHFILLCQMLLRMMGVEAVARTDLLPPHFPVYIDGRIGLSQVSKLFSCHWHLHSGAMYEASSHCGGTGP